MNGRPEAATATISRVLPPPRVRQLELRAPLYWLGRGFDDPLAAPAASLFYGVTLAAMG